MTVQTWQLDRLRDQLARAITAGDHAAEIMLRARIAAAMKAALRDPLAHRATTGRSAPCATTRRGCCTGTASGDWRGPAAHPSWSCASLDGDR